MALDNLSSRDRRRCRQVLVFVLAWTMATAGQSRAADPPQDAKQAAKALFMSGQRHYNLNEFPQAQSDFKEAYRLLPDPVFLYNLGQCERQLGHYEEAIRFYRSFLREQPKALNRQDVLHKIEEMEAVQKNKQPDVDKAAPPLAPIPDAEAGKPALPAAEVKAAPETEPALPPTPAPPVATATPAPSLLPASPPVAPAPTSASIDRLDLSAQPAAPAPAAQPAFYSHWWFWGATAAIVAGASIGIYAATASKAPSAPGSALGTQKVF
jgi:tetratricopeptide (TPR) repeat protein